MTLRPPSAWEIDVGSWETDANRSNVSSMGAYSVEFLPTTTATEIIESKLTTVEPYWARGLKFFAYIETDGQSPSIDLVLHTYDVNKSFITSHVVGSATFAAAGTYTIGSTYGTQLGTLVRYVRMSVRKSADAFGFRLVRVVNSLSASYGHLRSVSPAPATTVIPNSPTWVTLADWNYTSNVTFGWGLVPDSAVHGLRCVVPGVALLNGCITWEDGSVSNKDHFMGRIVVIRAAPVFPTSVNENHYFSSSINGIPKATQYQPNVVRGSVITPMSVGDYAILQAYSDNAVGANRTILNSDADQENHHTYLRGVINA